MTLHVFGIRHHGPGCARSLRAALEELRPDLLLLEGPTDANAVLPLAADADLQPPVALLLYVPEEPARAACFPFAVFSPEWQALQWAFAQAVPIRLMDLPQAQALALAKAAEEVGVDRVDKVDGVDEVEDGQEEVVALEPAWRTDPIALLAQAAGYQDHELWWEEQIERRAEATGLFSAILDAMRAVRAEFPETRPLDLLREAHMRRTIRAAVKEGFARIAIVCGAWHAPVLDETAIHRRQGEGSAKDDAQRLKGLPALKTTATWIPWTHSRLSYRSGYGAGIASPGWYSHLWTAPDQVATRWVTGAARLLRTRDLDASAADVIETVRLADTLAALRELRAPGLTELNEAMLAVLCHGEAAPLQLIRQQLEIGEALGTVPATTPTVPLAQDLASRQKALRLKPSPEIRTLDLDLRQPTDLGRSRLLHGLTLLGILWGQVQASRSRVSTFHELWQLQWQPEFAVTVIEASVWGGTVVAAATARVIHDASQATELAELTRLLDATVLAGLPAAGTPLLARIQAQAALAADLRQLLEALLPLARVARYGDVRGTSAAALEPLIVGLLERALVGLVAACTALDDAAAERMAQSIGHAQQALDLLDRADLLSDWQTRLRQLLENEAVHGLLRGGCCRLLLEQGRLTTDELQRLTRLALSPVNPAATCAAWVTGLLRGSGLALLHQEGVWAVFDEWLSALSETTFVELLPLLRRAFAGFSAAERRQMGEKVKYLGQGRVADADRVVATSDDLNHERARWALPVLAQILGVTYDDEERRDQPP